MNFQNLQSIIFCLQDNTNENKSYTTVRDLVTELDEISDIPDVYAKCDDYRDLEMKINKSFLDKEIDDVSLSINEENINLIIEAAESYFNILDYQCTE